MNITTNVEEYPALGHNYVNSVCDRCGEPVPLIIKDTDGNVVGGFTDLTEALRQMQEGQMVLLQTDVTAADMILPSGVTIDLNGNSLTVDSLLTYSSSAIVDTSEDVSGFLKINDEEGNMISASNSQLPVYDSANGGYRFFAIDVQPCAVTGGNKYWFRVKAEKFAMLYELICADSEVRIKAKMTWDGQTEDAYAVADLAFTKTWAEGYKANGDIYITVSVKNAENLENFKLIPMITSAGVEIPGEEM